MRFHLLLSLSFGIGMAAHAAGDLPAPEEACATAMRAYLNGGRTPGAEKHLREACFASPARSPVLRPPIVVEGTVAAPAPITIPAPDTRMPSTPSILTQCDAAGCWDNLGRRYSGGGPILRDPSGAACVRSGDRIECR